MHLRETFEVSERRACRVLNQPRSSQRHVSTRIGKDAALMKKKIVLSLGRTRATATGGYGRFSEVGRAGR